MGRGRAARKAGPGAFNRRLGQGALYCGEKETGMSDDLPPSGALPSAGRPLLGLTVLAVEDSRFACEALRLLCLRSGARLRRADCLGAARRHLRAYRPHAVIVDLGLPDGRGEALIGALHRREPRPAVVLGSSGDDGAKLRALRAGADGFLAKPVASLSAFQQAILSRIKDPARHALRALHDETVHPDPLALRDDLLHAAAMLAGRPDGAALNYAAQFLRGLARAAQDHGLEQAAGWLDARDAGGLGRVRGILQSRIRAAARV